MQRGGGPKKRFQYRLDLYTAETIENLRAIQGHSGGKQIDPTLQDNVVTERLRRVHLSRWKLPRSALDHSIRVYSRWQRRQERETCGVLHGRESYVHTSAQAEGLRRGEAQNCSVQTK